MPQGVVGGEGSAEGVANLDPAFGVGIQMQEQADEAVVDAKVRE